MHNSEWNLMQVFNDVYIRKKLYPVNGFSYFCFQIYELEDGFDPFNMEIWRCFFTDTRDGINICELEIKDLGH